MKISPLSNNISKTNFKSLIIKPSADQYIERMPKDERKSIYDIKERKRDDKYYDVVVEGSRPPYIIEKGEPYPHYSYVLYRDSYERLLGVDRFYQDGKSLGYTLFNIRPSEADKLYNESNSARNPIEEACNTVDVLELNKAREEKIQAEFKKSGVL